MAEITLSVSVGLLWVIVGVLTIVVLALAHQIGVLHERIAPVGALMTAKGLKVGERVPSVDAIDLDGRLVNFANSRTDNISTLLLFVSPTCPVCKTLLPIIKEMRKSEHNALEIVLASDGDVTEHQNFRSAEQLGDFSYILSAPLGMTFQIGRLPYAVLIDHTGVLKARGLINSREHLESLLEAQRLNVASIQDYMNAQNR